MVFTIIPMVLVNGCEGIGTGYSTFQHIIKRYHYKFIKMIDDDDFQPLPIKPYFKEDLMVKQPGRKRVLY
jgi:hypothetical protein